MEHFNRIVKSLGDRLDTLLDPAGVLESYPSFAAKLSDRLPRNAASSPVQTAAFVKMLYQMAMFMREGNRVFRLSSPLAIALSQTELSRVPCELVKLPFPSIFIEFPAKPTLVWLKSNDGTQFFPCEGAYITRIGNRLEIMLVGLGAAYQVEGQIYREDQVAYMVILVEDDRDLLDVMRESIHKCDISDKRQYTDQELEIMGQKSAYETLTQASTIIFNALLYISSPGADLSAPVQGEATRKLEAHPKKSEEWRARMRRIARKEATIVKVGEKLKHNAELEATFHADSGDKAYQLTVRFRVRGHWRHQPYGPGRAERKLIWVSPFWKGPTLAEVIQQSYSVE